MQNILIRFSHGLGDVIQLSVVLRHIREQRKDWEVDVRCGRGKHSALIGLCRKVFHDQEPEPDSNKYNTHFDLGWFENYQRYNNRPNTKITNCLSEVFNIDYDPRLGQYELRIPNAALNKAGHYYRTLNAVETNGRYNVVLLHYEGNTSQKKKNLLHWQAEGIIDAIIACGHIPIILDWDNRSPLPDGKRVFKPHTGKDDLWGNFGSGDAAMIAALIKLADSYIGVDSGPGKVASTTDTPSLICWKEHHPIQFHDPAPNTVHLVPANHRRMPPVEGDHQIASYFEKNYLFTTYEDDYDLTGVAIEWLFKTLGKENLLPTKPITYVVPPGIGDSVWALFKIKSICGGDLPVNIAIAGDPTTEIGKRAVPFLKRFDFINEVKVLDLPLHPDKDHNTDPQGRYIYEPDGLRGNYHYLVPNRVLERGLRLEKWYPDHPIDWEIIDHFSFADTEKGRELGIALKPFVAFYLGPETGNVDEGHNRGFAWEPRHWNALGKAFTDMGLSVAVVGAPYDRSYWERYVRDGVKQNGMEWIDFIGELEIGNTFALLKEAKLFVSYQCGLAIMMHYFGQNVVSWWRPDGDSCHPTRKVMFDDGMKDSFTNPKYADRWMGCLYKRQTVGDILAHIERKGWLK